MAPFFQIGYAIEKCYEFNAVNALNVRNKLATLKQLGQLFMFHKILV